MTTDKDPILEMYFYEASQMIEQTEVLILQNDHTAYLDEVVINEIFRCMHTLKGSSAMMQFDGIAEIAHTLEDIIHFIRENIKLQYNPVDLSNLILESVDYFKLELAIISEFGTSNKTDNFEQMKNKLVQFLDAIKLQDAFTSEKVEAMYDLHIMFTEDCEMEGIRAYQLIHHLQDFMVEYTSVPQDVISDEQASDYIKKHGFKLSFNTKASYDELFEAVNRTAYLKSISLNLLSEVNSYVETEITETKIQPEVTTTNSTQLSKEKTISSTKSSVVSVNVQKLDKLMDLVGELVIAEAMVANTIRTLSGDEHNNVIDSSQLSKITSDLQDTIMSIRMVPLSPVFHKMRRITRDMCLKLNKKASIELIGEETEIDKSVIDQISDPLMHIIRNCIDHGIEDQETRLSLGKPEEGKVVLEARNIGSDVLLIISDDGKGINKDRILEKAFEAGLISSTTTELTDREIYQFVFHPGLSTKEEITEFSGRGVGMDVVASNIESIGGTIYIESQANKGTTFTIKIPLTLAIIDGMNVRVGQSHFTVPTTSIKESFRPGKQQIIQDLSNQNMVMVRGEIYNIINLSHYFSISADYSDPHEAILLMIEHEDKVVCIQVDELVGQQQVVIKPLPAYLKNFAHTNRLSGCTLLGDGSISIILNVNELLH